MPASIRCGRCTRTHSSVEDVRACYAAPQAASLVQSGSLELEPVRPSTNEALIVGLMPQVPDGYYAVQRDTSAQMVFMRLSQVKVDSRSRLAGCRKVQTIHGPNLELAWALFPDGRARSYTRLPIEESLLLLLANYQAAAKRYAKEIGKCARCNTRLTSDWRKHGIGPECVKHWPFMLEEEDPS